MTSRPSVLVVDDEPLVARSLARCLRREHDVQCVESAKEALDLVTAGLTPDVIFLDVMMPQMTGLDLYRELERVAPTLLDRVVFLTGGGFGQAMREALEALPNQKVLKPFDAQALCEVARAMVATRR